MYIVQEKIAILLVCNTPELFVPCYLEVLPVNGILGQYNKFPTPSTHSLFTQSSVPYKQPVP